VSLKSANGLSYLSYITSVCPASSGEQAIANALSRCSSMQGLQGEGRGLHYSGQTCCGTESGSYFLNVVYLNLKLIS